MKRGNTKRSNHANNNSNDPAYPFFPPEILHLISDNVWTQSTKLNDLLNWHATCKHYWNEYQNIDDDKLLAFAEEKRNKNQDLLKKFFQVQYRHNILVWTDFEMILQICKIIKEKIVSLVDTKFYESSNTDPATEIYNINKWEKWKGIKFDDGILSKHSKDLLIAVTPRIAIRYGWQLIFSSKEDDHSHDLGFTPVKKNNTLLFYPWSGPLAIKPKSMCYVGDCCNVDMEKFMNLNRFH
jgi:hypothetical protein